MVRTAGACTASVATHAGESTLCMDIGMNITLATGVSADNHGNTYVAVGKRVNDEERTDIFAGVASSDIGKTGVNRPVGVLIGR